ncbi:unnamed protein product [Arctia plantaginis]|uniref:THAP-type domain-containing protein n=1 Tax=Arctia plantaginis TaxID=874455 RepID=A0A8S0ZNK6_ARCPL|nr:unnamed protein product [Arctia plantaginis]
MPRRSQCVFGCQQFDVLHRFPIPETSLERFLQWKDIVGPKLQDKTNDDIYTNYRICNHHFEGRHCYPHSKRLAKTAYPTLKLGSSASSSQDVSIEIQLLPQPLPESMDIHSVPQTLPGCSAHVSNLDLMNKTGNARKVKQTKRIKIMMKKIINLKKQTEGAKKSNQGSTKIVQNKII